MPIDFTGRHICLSFSIHTGERFSFERDENAGEMRRVRENPDLLSFNIEKNEK
jgi:hypothetical protein